MNVRKSIAALALLGAVCFNSLAQMPERTAENVEKYKKICRDNIRKDMRGMYRKPVGSLKYPFLVPGSNQYPNQLWDWDSFLADIALRQNVLDNGKEKDLEELFEYEKGCVLNFLSYGGGDGWIPICITAELPGRSEAMQMLNPWSSRKVNPYKSNMHKPVLAQHAAFIVQENGGDAEWLREGFYNLQTFVGRYLNYQRDKATGLLYWENDAMVGVDNDPSVYYRPAESCGSILLNSFMYKELLSMSYLATCLGMDDISERYSAEAENLLQCIRKHCWDPRDGFYYSVDLNLLPVEKPDDASFHYHTGQPRQYDCLIQRISVWSGFLAMWSGVATPEQAKIIVERQYRDTSLFNAPAGVYTLSPLEKMYDVRASGNPSSWLGPVWGCVNYFVFKALVNYGYDADARELAEKTVLLLGRDYERFGALHEYYLPSGEPVLNKGFQNWNLLVLNMIDWLDGRKVVSEF